MVRKKAIKRVVWKILLFIIGTIIFKTPFIPVLIIYVLKAIGFRGRNFDPEADAKIKEVEQKILGLIDEHEITKKAVANANEIIAKAQKDGKEIRLASLKFADEILEKVEIFSIY